MDASTWLNGAIRQLLWGQGESISFLQLQVLVYVTSLWERCSGAEILGVRPLGLEACRQQS